jgi:hypothetical protein
MPLTAKGSEVMAKLKKEYGPESGERVFYAMKNKGTLTGVDSDDLRDDKDDILSLNRRRATDAFEKADREGLIRQPRADGLNNVTNAGIVHLAKRTGGEAVCGNRRAHSTFDRAGFEQQDPSARCVRCNAKLEVWNRIKASRGDADVGGTPEDQVPIPADYGTKLDAAADAADKLMVRLGSYMDRNDAQMCNIADSDVEAERHGIEIGGKREMVR